MCVLANCVTRCYKCIERNVNMLLLKWSSVRRELVRCTVLIRRFEQIWILYTLYMWHYFRGVMVRNLSSGKEKAERVGVKQSIPATAQPLTFLTPAHLPPTLNLLAWHSHLKAQRLQIQGGAEEDGSAQVLLRVFLPQACQSVSCLCAPQPMRLACHHNISCSLQTIRRCWPYFKSVCV